MTPTSEQRIADVEEVFSAHRYEEKPTEAETLKRDGAHARASTSRSSPPLQ